jgi:serine protease AprX
MKSRIVLALLCVAYAANGVRAQLPSPNPPAPPPPPSPLVGKLDPILVEALARPADRSKVIVRASSAALVDEIAALIVQANGSLGHRLPLIEAQAAELPNAALAALTNQEAVARIAADRIVVATLERTGATIGSTAARSTFGYDGSGVGVAIIDSGISQWHDDLGDGAGGQRVDQFVDLINAGHAPYDDHGHGTHVAGIIAGNGYDSAGKRTGVAPRARLVVLKALDSQGRGRISDVIAALGYVVATKDQFGIRIVNLSIGAAVSESYHTDLLTLSARRAVDAGLIVVAAAGNKGRSEGHTIYGGITAPGNAPWVLTVGAFSHAGTARRGDDSIAPFSSRGPTAVDYLAKPDIVAPGVGIESLSDPASAMYTTRASSLLDGTVATSYLPYLSLSGTSQATPVVSGTIALMLQANPHLTANAVKAILQYAAFRRGYDALTEGGGFLNAYGAIELARYFAAPATPLHRVDRHWSRQLIWGNHRVSGGYLLPGANAWAADVQWGAPGRTGGPVAWGAIPISGEDGTPQWADWGTQCADVACTHADWRSSSGAENVVWGSTCGGDDCPAATSAGNDDGLVWMTADDGDTIVWGTHDEDTIVWGTHDEDTIVWGTHDEDTIVWGTHDQDTIVWGTADEDTIVWGTNDEETIVWGTSCDDASCAQ